MKSEFTAIIESAPEGGFWAVCPEVLGANGQGDSIEEAKQNLIEAIELILESVKGGGHSLIAGQSRKFIL